MKSVVRVAVLLVPVLFVTGCGSKACSVTGTVTYSGQPLQAGSVGFDPDGFDGPSAMVAVEDGRFEVPANKQLAPGKYTVRVFQPGGKSGEPMLVTFPPYITSAELPAGPSTLELAVPASPSQPQPKR